MKKAVLIMMFMLLLVGCANNGNDHKNHKESQSNQSEQSLMNVKNSNIEEVDRKTGQDIAKRLVTLSTSIPGVNDASAVVLGKYAIVGIDIKSNVDRSEVGSIKYSVAESLKNDPYGAYAMIIADPDVTARLKEMSEDIRNGEPVQGIFNELADMTGRLMPEVPSDMINPNPKTNIKDPDEKLNNKEEKDIKRDQNEQSNQHLRD
ncbi:YhcN/YlaJ family sporulation lipoprotein [Niallia sp. 01092]|uniref:YhcN/YlaJ family sporulation lipoprotein n=1 Tax=unclassified Niallia TaxID=2837522 RepID=UPI003FD2CA53